MTTVACLLLCFLHTRWAETLRRTEIRVDGCWWCTYGDGWKTGSRVYRWPWHRDRWDTITRFWQFPPGWFSQKPHLEFKPAKHHARR